MLYQPRWGKEYKVKYFIDSSTIHVVYMLKCPCGLVYIRQTKRCLKLRVAERKTAICTKIWTIRIAEACLGMPFFHRPAKIFGTIRHHYYNTSWLNYQLHHESPIVEALPTWRLHQIRTVILLVRVGFALGLISFHVPSHCPYTGHRRESPPQIQEHSPYWST